MPDLGLGTPHGWPAVRTEIAVLVIVLSVPYIGQQLLASSVLFNSLLNTVQSSDVYYRS